MATIRKRGDLQWEAQVRKKGQPAQSRTFSTRADADRWAKETEIAIERGLFFDRSIAERTTINELIEKYKEVELPAKRGKHFIPALTQLRDTFGPYSLASITPKMISKHRDARLQLVSPSTVKKEINLLSRIIELAGKEWGIPVANNPCKMVSRPSEPKGRERRLVDGEEFADGEEAKLLAQCLASSKDLEVIAIVAIESAARLGELLTLTWMDVDLKKRTALLRKTKNGESRTIPLSTRAVTALQELRTEQAGKENNIAILPTQRVFRRWKAADSFNKVWVRACMRASISDLRFHDLRHEACSRLADKFSLHELMKISGHKTAAMLMRYYHPKAEELAKRLG